jgi:hypothetical protein
VVLAKNSGIQNRRGRRPATNGIVKGTAGGPGIKGNGGKMIVYLSGPITGIRDQNRRAFLKVAKKIKETFADLRQLIIIDPHNLAELLELQFTKKNLNLYHAEKPAWADYMKADIPKLLAADCVYFLKNWQKSKGAVLEHTIAEALGIPIAETIEELQEISGRLK